MKLICIKNTQSISTNGHPTGVETKYFEVGEQYDVQDDYPITNQHYFVIYYNGSNYSVFRTDFTTVENWRQKQLNELGI
jgi:hypothetical protein